MPVSVLNVSKPWKKNELTRWLIFFSIAIIFTALDLITKYLTYKINTIDIVPGVLEFRFISNKGIIWGLFSQGSLLFIVISSLAIPLIIFMFKYIYVFVCHETNQEDAVQPLPSVNNDGKPLDIAGETPVPIEAISKHTDTNEIISTSAPTNSCHDNGMGCQKNLLPPEMPIRKFSVFSIIGMLTIACGLILAGAIGNLYDRIFYEGVRDFISFYIINWPIFNLADVFITIGAFLIIFCMFKKPYVAKTNSIDDTRGA